ncbi:MAG: 2-oxoacid:acceptor oxidoreductase family protein, partial [Anaerolineae bacterium]|nr:2-oxoacid:acceptor oxidoreductase family protein [Anaerolineae bacterium]
IYNSDSIKEECSREDIKIYPVPVKTILQNHDIPNNLKDYVANMVYIGVLAYLINIDMDCIREALDFHFKGKPKPLNANMAIIQSAFDWSMAEFEKSATYQVEKMGDPHDYIMASGNTAAAIGSIYGGLQYCAWYPITPATGLIDSLSDYFPLLRQDPESGKNTYAVVQAEDELSAVGMTIGAGWAGLRSMTATSGPGLSLMAEYLGLAYFTEVPIVVWDVQRVGPSTGMPTRTAQADLTFANFISHGDKKHIILLPANIDECFEFAWKSLDIAGGLQTPTLVLIDLDLGMNHWMGKRFSYPDRPIDRGKILWEEDLERILDENNGTWGRYMDIDHDGIPYRTVPGNMHPRSAYFARGTGHDEYARYTEDPEIWEKTMDRIAKKMETAVSMLPEPVINKDTNSKIGLIAFGTTDDAVNEARCLLKQKGMATDYLRVRAIPFDIAIRNFILEHETVYVIELNRDGQMKQLLTLEAPDLAYRLKLIAHADGLPMTALYIVNHLLAQEGK